MEKEDEYLVFVRKGDGSRFYYKNRKMHREAGPAIVCPTEIEKYTGLSDEGLHKETVIDLLIIDSGAEVSTINLEKLYEFTVVEDSKEITMSIPNGQSFVVIEAPSAYFMGSLYYLDGIKLSEKEFDASILRNKIENELEQTSSTTNKKPKI